MTPAVRTLRRWLADRDLGADDAAEVLGMRLGVVARILGEIDAPSPDARERIEQWTEGAVPARLWPARLRVIGPHLEVGPGQRLDCVRDDRCLEEFVRRHMPRAGYDERAAAAHCPTGCKYFEPVDRDLEVVHAALARRDVV